MNHPESGESPRHVSVLPVPVVEYLAPGPGQVIVDATVGAGGHSLLLARALGPTGRLIGLDRDPAMLEVARARLTEFPVTLVHANFDQLRQVLDDQGLSVVDGVVADLGICSDQLDEAERGFSFSRSGPLDMRMDRTEGDPAGVLLRQMSEKDLADMIYRYGEERFSRRIARRIVEQRRTAPLETTEQLAELVRRCVPRPKGGRRSPAIDPATRVFQALRIAVNDELESLERLLKVLPGCVKPGGRAVLISFHSLEDRLVKLAFKESQVWEAFTRKPIQADEQETTENPRARSAKLRAARRVSESSEKTQEGARRAGKKTWSRRERLETTDE
jgi:16S rRNA (cytosine1402-N4)-methyltransferase